MNGAMKNEDGMQNRFSSKEGVSDVRKFYIVVLIKS